MAVCESARRIVRLVIRGIAVFGFVLATTPSAFPQDDEDLPAPTTLEELETAILEVLEETNTPAVSITLVSRDEVIWTAGLGKADLANSIDATPETLFRIGSVSKMFIALAVLQLVERGQLSLGDRVRDLVPEIAFDNPWSETNPILVAHLLEHTTGFDDVHLVEFANRDPTPLTLRQGLDLHPHSRTARWRPGTRFSYSNAGPAVAAYIVEQITGQNFEEYVQDNVFDPLSMTTASFLFTDAVRERLATLYAGGTRPAPYWHISLRPVGSINASANDMSGFVQMLLNRGELGGVRIVSETSMRRMETPATTLGAQSGMERGYALANYSLEAYGFVFHGHDGGMTGGLAGLGYLPEYGLGYALMINSDNGGALQRIVRLTRRFLTIDLEPPTLPAGRVVPAAISEEFEGFFRMATVRPEVMRFLMRLLIVVRLSIDGERITVTPLLSADPIEYIALSDRLARQDDDPLSSLALLDSVDSGTQIEVAMAGTLVKVSAGLVWFELGLAITSLAFTFSALVFVLIWGPRRLFGKLKGEPGIGVRAWPLLTVVILVASCVLLVMGAAADPITNLGTPTVYSVGYAVLSAGFFAAACWSILVLWRARSLSINRIARWHSGAVISANALVAGYLLYWGMIGLPMWLL